MVLLKIIGLFMLNLLALWGLAWVMFRDKEDFIDSFCAHIQNTPISCPPASPVVSGIGCVFIGF